MIDVKTWKATASWPLDPCKGPTGIAYDKAGAPATPGQTALYFAGLRSESAASVGFLAVVFEDPVRVVE